MTLEQYTVLAYHFIYLTFFVPTIYDTIKFQPLTNRKVQIHILDQYLSFIAKRLWNTHFGDLFVGIILAGFWPLFSLFSICYIIWKLPVRIGKDISSRKSFKNKKNKVR